jgi:hypothetical protein
MTCYAQGPSLEAELEIHAVEAAELAAPKDDRPPWQSIGIGARLGEEPNAPQADQPQ